VLSAALICSFVAVDARLAHVVIRAGMLPTPEFIQSIALPGLMIGAHGCAWLHPGNTKSTIANPTATLLPIKPLMASPVFLAFFWGIAFIGCSPARHGRHSNRANIALIILTLQDYRIM